jgi:hypothetical protein
MTHCVDEAALAAILADCGGLIGDTGYLRHRRNHPYQTASRPEADRRLASVQRAGRVNTCRRETSHRPHQELANHDHPIPRPPRPNRQRHPRSPRSPSIQRPPLRPCPQLIQTDPEISFRKSFYGRYFGLLRAAVGPKLPSCWTSPSSPTGPPTPSICCPAV